MQFETIRFTLEQGVAHVQFNRPDKANSLNETLWAELQAAFEQIDANPDARVAVLSGTGKHFCAGIDLNMLIGLQQAIYDNCEGRKREKLLAKIEQLQGAVSSLERCRKPVIAAIHGGCIGGGLDIALAADFRFAAADAGFCVKEIDIGMTADVGTLQRLPRVVGEGVAREMALTGRKLGADEALAVRLVNKVLPDAEAVVAHALEVAAGIAAKSPLAVRGTKTVLNYSRDHSVEEGLRFVAQWNAATLISNDIQAAVMASMSGQKPEFGA